MRINIKSVAAGIAAAIGASNHFDVVYSLPSPQPVASSATVIPSGGAPTNRCVAALKHDVLIVAASSNFETALDWLTDGVAAVSDALDADPTCGGVCNGVRVASWAEVHMVNIGGGADALAIRITLSETNPTKEP